MNFVNNDNDHILYLENSFRTITDDLVHLGVIQQLKNNQGITTSLESACKMFKCACSMGEKANHRIQVVPGIWACHQCVAFEGSPEWLL